MLEKSYKNCSCQSSNYCDNKDNLLEKFKSIRDKCPAIKEILIPDNFLEKFLNIAKKNISEDDFMIKLAFERGYLKNITRPIHKFLLDRKQDILPNYKKDLTEFWMTNYQSPQERNKISKRSFLGRFCELLLADWLDEHDYSIIGLAALGAGYDIIAENDQGKINIEVKYIGHEEWFNDKLHDINKCFSPDPNYPHDYLLYIAYTAAKQLCEKSNENKVITILLQNLSHHDLDWIERHNPNFYEIERDFIDKKKYPNIENEIHSIFKQIDEIWFFHTNNFTCNLIKKVKTR